MCVNRTAQQHDARLDVIARLDRLGTALDALCALKVRGRVCILGVYIRGYGLVSMVHHVKPSDNSSAHAVMRKLSGMGSGPPKARPPVLACPGPLGNKAKQGVNQRPP